MKTQKEPAKTLKIFGRPYVLAGTFNDAAELKLVKSNWQKFGHSVMMKGQNLYVSQYKNRS